MKNVREDLIPPLVRRASDAQNGYTNGTFTHECDQEVVSIVIDRALTAVVTHSLRRA